MLELQLQGGSKLDPHYLESYRTALQAVMLLQFSQRGTPQDRAGILSLGQQPALRAVLAAEGCAPAALLDLNFVRLAAPRLHGAQQQVLPAAIVCRLTSRSMCCPKACMTFTIGAATHCAHVQSYSKAHLPLAL